VVAVAVALAESGCAVVFLVGDMIEFRRNESNVRAIVKIHVPTVGLVDFNLFYSAGNEYYAGFLASKMDETMHEAIEAIRREAYERGWKEARGHKSVKATWFSRYW
jgi:hypothetical protein